MPIVAHTRTFVVGVDSHARTHTLAVLVAGTGELGGSVFAVLILTMIVFAVTE